MSRVPLADFEPGLKKRLTDLWGTPPNLYRCLANHPALVAAWTEFSKMLRHDTRTPRALREAQISALANWRTSGEFDEREKAALELAEAVTNGRVSDEVYARVTRHFDHHGYVELAAVAAFYAMVGRMLDAMGVPLDEDVRDYQPKLK